MRSLTYLLCLGISACAPTRPAGTGPRDALRQYVAAIRSNKPKIAYGYLSKAVQKKMTEAEFSERFGHLRRELLGQAAEIDRRIRQPVDISARVAYAGGTRASLRYVEQRWHIDSGISIAFQTATPIEAIKAFMRAVEQRSYQAAIKLLSRSVRESVERDIKERIKKLRAWIKADNEIEVTGDRARIRYAPRYKIELVSEDGQWKVLDFN